MDELKTAWSDLKESKSHFYASNDAELLAIISAKSISPIDKIKKKVLIKLIMCVIVLLLFGVYLPFANPFISQVLIVFLIIGYTIGSILLFQEYNSIKNGVDMSQNLLSGLKHYRSKILQIIKYEEIIGLILYPISGPAGFFIGIKLQDADAPILEERIQWIALAAIIIVLTPFGHFFTKWMNKLVLGKYLIQIDENIELLEKN